MWQKFMSEGAQAGASHHANFMGTNVLRKASSKAKKEAVAGIRRGMQEYRAGFNRIDSLYEPWRQEGTNALQTVRQGIAEGRFTPGEFQFSYEDFQQDPGYQFRFDESLKALDRGGAARGKRLSGEQEAAAIELAGNLASQEYGNAYGRALTEYDLDNQRRQAEFNQYMPMLNYGYNATGQTANYRQRLADALAAGEMNIGNVMAGHEINKGNIRAGSYAQHAATHNKAVSNMFGGGDANIQPAQQIGGGGGGGMNGFMGDINAGQFSGMTA